MCQEIQVFLAHKIQVYWHIGYVRRNSSFLGFVAHILCAIKMYWHFVYVPRKNFLDTGIADVYLMSIINVKMSFLGI